MCLRVYIKVKSIGIAKDKMGLCYHLQNCRQREGEEVA